MKLLLVFLCMCSALVSAQQQAPSSAAKKPAAPAQKPTAAATASEPATNEDVAHLMESMHIEKQMEEMQRAMLNQYRPMIERMTADQIRLMTPEQRQKVQNIVSQTLTDSLKAYPPAEMIKDMVPIYAKYLNKGDVAAMIRFYSSPTGKKFLDVQPKIVNDFMAELVPKMQDRVQGSLRKMQEQIQALMNEQPPQPPREREFKPATPAPSAPAPSATPAPEPSPTPAPK